MGREDGGEVRGRVRGCARGCASGSGIEPQGVRPAAKAQGAPPDRRARSGAWPMWGQGDVQSFQGEPSAVSGYAGDVRTGYVA